jgi:hypothetical protein
LSYTHFDKTHRDVAIPAAAEPPTDPGGRQGSAWRGFLWAGLIVIVLIIAFDRLTTPPPPVQLPTSPRTLAQTAAQTAAQAVSNERVAEIKRAALGVTQIRHAVTNSNTLRLSQVTMMPTGVLCYQLHLQNSRGVAYVRTAVIDGALLKTSGSDGFNALWNRHCARPSGGRDITSVVENSLNLSPK